MSQPVPSDALAELERRALEERPDGYLALLEELRRRLEDPSVEG
ncbi:MAG: hypothetical protein JWP66_1215 [Naasia sp.]|nr:hypothetical protein [Naasia sp.]